MNKKNIKRFNMAFTKENYEYISIMSGVFGISMTDLVNVIVSSDAEKNAEKVKAILAIIEKKEG